MKSKGLKVHNLPTDVAPITSINAKPDLLLIGLVGLGIALAATNTSRIYGIAIIFVGFVALAFMPKVTLMEFYNEYLVMYNRADKDSCVLIYYDEVLSWHYQKGNRDYLFIELENGTTESIEAFSKYLFEVKMNGFMKEKHRRNVKQ